MIYSKVIIIDFGSQLTQLIARRVREAGVYSEIHPCIVNAAQVKAMKPSAIILSGGPASVGEKDAPTLDMGLLDLGVPILGICYGMQLLAINLGGELQQSATCEYGPAELSLKETCPLWHGLKVEDMHRVWMSHGDKVNTVPQGFCTIASTQKLQVAAMMNESKNIYAVQFHPEVHHTTEGEKIIHNFLFKIAKIKADWTMSSFVEHVSAQIKEQVGPEKQVICALSGGIDSTVAAILLHQVIGHRLHCVFVDNGLLRKGEAQEVADYLRKHFDLNLIFVPAQEIFLSKLVGITDPEQKRKIIGHTFIEIFDQEAKKLGNVQYLAQGTLYPDVIESISHKGPSAVIKSHHNVGGLPETMNLKLIEPLRELFKDEVRKVAMELGLPDAIVWRHPFPGPGLAIRLLGEITEERLNILRNADIIVQSELKDSGWYNKIWQGFAILLPIKTVGVMGDGRTYGHVVALRMVDSIDAMTADWSRIPHELLAKISSRIINEVEEVNRVVYDISSKPPSTIEWE